MPASKGRWWLTHDSHQTVISTTPGRIYDLVSDLPRMGEWSPECERVEWTDGTTVAAEGARFVGHNRGGPFRLMRWSRHGRVIAAGPGREFAFVTEEGGRESTVWRYRFEPVEVVLTDGELRQTVACFEYQSCEHPEWEASWARGLCRRLRETTADPEGPYGDSAPWGWDDLTLAQYLAAHSAA